MQVEGTYNYKGVMSVVWGVVGMVALLHVVNSAAIPELTPKRRKATAA